MLLCSQRTGGVPGISRPRGYGVLINREKVEVMGSPLDMYRARAMLSELCMSVYAMLIHAQHVRPGTHCLIER